MKKERKEGRKRKKERERKEGRKEERGKKVTYFLPPPLLLDTCPIRGYGGIFDEEGIFFMGQLVRFCPK